MEPHFDVPASNPEESADSSTPKDSSAGADSATDFSPTPSFDDQQTSSYAPPTEPRTSWAPAGWAVQTPPHWFEPIAEPEPVRDRDRGSPHLAPFFVVALVAAILGSLITYGALMATSKIGPPVAQVSPPTPTLAAPGSANIVATPAPLPVANTAITDAAQRVSPAVVTITVRSGQSTDPSSLPETGVGSGIIYDAGGFVLTNRHVVGDAAQVTVELNDGRTVDGTVYGVDTLTDLAIVKIDATDVPTAPLGDSATLAARADRDRHRQSAGYVHQQRHLGRRLRAGPLAHGHRPGHRPAAQTAQPHPDRRRNQSRQLRWTHGQHGW